MTHQLSWRTASPLWSLDASDPSPLRHPALLRFTHDDFMADLAARLGDEGLPFSDLLAAPETWRDTASSADLIGAPDPGDEPTGPLRLYHPAHARFYLVAANLVCRRPGLPDHRTGRAEHTSVLLRQLRDRDGVETEHAWVAGRWQPLTGPLPVSGEQRLPLVPTVHGRDGHRRRLLTALVPVAAREAYQAGSTVPAAEPGEDPLADPRHARLLGTVVEPLHELWRAAATGSPAHADPVTESFVFSVVELSDVLRRVAGLAAVFGTGRLRPTATAVRDHLAAAAFSADLSWLDALAVAERRRADVLVGGTLPEDLHLPRDGVAAAVTALSHPAGRRAAPTAPPEDPLDWTLVELVGAHLDATPSEPDAPGEADGTVPAPEVGARYVARCLYEKDGCPIRPEWVSEPTEPFQLAPFFDADAPTRTHRIALPFDASPAGLRRFPRNVSMMISAQLRRQMAKVDDLTVSDVENGDLKDEGGSDLGMVCSLSIPIITIAALVLLMVIVSLLNIVFWWKPLFKVCAPAGRSA